MLRNRKMAYFSKKRAILEFALYVLSQAQPFWAILVSTVMVPVRGALTRTKNLFLVSFLENHGLEIRKLQIRNFKNFRKRI